MMMSRTARRLCAGFIRLGLFALTAEAVYLQMHRRSSSSSSSASSTAAVAPGTTGSTTTAAPPLVDHIALACCTNLLIALLYMCYAAMRRLVCVMYYKNRDWENDGSAATSQLVCVVAHHQESLRFSDADPIVQARMANAGALQRILYLTPSLLWYYVYTVGLAVFGLSYTVQNASLVQSLALGLGCVLCSAWFLVLDTPAPLLRVTARNAVRLALVITVLVCLVLVAVDEAAAPLLQHKVHNSTANNSTTTTTVVVFWYDTWRGNWLGLVIPFAAPALLGSCRCSRLKAARLDADRVVLFALPFLAAVSLCYLSMHAPLQKCVALTSSVEAYLNGSTSMDLLQLIEANVVVVHRNDNATGIGADRDAPVQTGAADVGVWLLAAGSMWCTLVAFTSAMTHTDNMLSCSLCFCAVLVCKQALVAVSDNDTRPLLTGSAVATSIAALCALAEGSTCPDMETLQSDMQHAELYARASRLSDLDALYYTHSQLADTAEGEGGVDCSSCSAFSIGNPDED